MGSKGALGFLQKSFLKKSSGGYIRSVVVSKHTSVFIINHHGRKFTDAENDILKRFAKVFEQTYTRFLDLQKAEAQAREAQIEASLERVRSKAMAMHKSADLLEVVKTLGEQFKFLGFKFDSVNFNTDYKEKDYKLWLYNSESALFQPCTKDVQNGNGVSVLHFFKKRKR